MTSGHRAEPFTVPVLGVEFQAFNDPSTLQAVFSQRGTARALKMHEKVVREILVSDEFKTLRGGDFPRGKLDTTINSRPIAIVTQADLVLLVQIAAERGYAVARSMQEASFAVLLQQSVDEVLQVSRSRQTYLGQTKNGTPMRRDNLLRGLLPDYCEGIDYHLLKFEEMVKRPQGGGKSMDKYYLTVDCFKMMSMQVPGERGRKVRLFFVRCERELKCHLEEERKRWQESTQKRLMSAMVSVEVVSRKPKFSDEFYELLYKKRGNGWENRDPKKNRPGCVGTWTNWTVYDRLLGGTEPGGVKDTLNQVNPKIDGRRKDRHHWHLKELGEFHLSSQLEVVKAVARLSPDGNWDKFMRNIQKACPNGEAVQLSLLDMLEEIEPEAS